MAVLEKNRIDVEKIIEHRYDQGADYWTTPDKRLIKGSPFSMLECVSYLLELGMETTDPMLIECSELIFDAWQEDGRFKLYPTGAIYPCQTIHALSTLCHLGHVGDIRLQKTFQYLFEQQHRDGGWRCNKFSFGRGPETEFSNPLPTLIALDAFRYSHFLNQVISLDYAVEFLLEHWRIKQPIGPCHYGIGTLFMQLEYPFRNYNLFLYVYILSFYKYAKHDPRFLEAFNILQSKLDHGQLVVERVAPKLDELSFCKKGQTSELATGRYQEILNNLQVK